MDFEMRLDNNYIVLVYPDFSKHTVAYLDEDGYAHITRDPKKHYVRKFQAYGVSAILIDRPPAKLEGLLIEIEDRTFKLSIQDFFLEAEGPLTLGAGFEEQYFISTKVLAEYEV